MLPVWQPLATEPGVLFQGGPVALDSALGLALVPGDGEEEPLGWRRVVGRVGLVDLDAPPEVLAAEVSRLRIFAGYAGWGAGQLEDELAEGAWYVVDARFGSPAGTTRATRSPASRRTSGARCCAGRAATWPWCRRTSTTRR